MTHDVTRGDDARLDAVLDALQQPAVVGPDRVAVVAARAVLANQAAVRTRRTLLRAAAVVVVLGGGALLAARRPSSTPLATPQVTAAAGAAESEPLAIPVAATSARPIVFELDAPDAMTVQVLGDFNGWSREASRMQRGSDGRWRFTTLLPPGRYVYAYLVDGTRFVRDPAREPVEDRDFGVTGSELVIGDAP